jgi:molybdenum-dependent DNA-binding transcriptional regulator ModE
MPEVVRTTRRRRRLGGDDLMAHLNTTISELIKQNRKLKRQIERLTAKGTAAASSNVDRALRTLQGRVERALTPTTGRRRRKSPTNGRRISNRRGRHSASKST